MGNKHTTAADANRVLPKALQRIVQRRIQVHGEEEAEQPDPQTWDDNWREKWTYEWTYEEFILSHLKKEAVYYRYSLELAARNGHPVRLMFQRVSDVSLCLALANVFNEATVHKKRIRRKGWDRPIYGALQPVVFEDETSETIYRTETVCVLSYEPPTAAPPYEAVAAKDKRWL